MAKHAATTKTGKGWGPITNAVTLVLCAFAIIAAITFSVLVIQGDVEAKTAFMGMVTAVIPVGLAAVTGYNKSGREPKDALIPASQTAPTGLGEAGVASTVPDAALVAPDPVASPVEEYESHKVPTETVAVAEEDGKKYVSVDELLK